MSRNNDIWLRKPAGLVLGLDFSGGRKDSCDGKVGTLVGGASIGASDRFVTLDGVNDYISFPDSADLSALNSGISVMAWVNMTTTADFRIVAKADGFSPAEWVLSVNATNNVFFSVYAGSFTANFFTALSTGNVAGDAGAWVLLTGIYTGSGTSAGLSVWRNDAAMASTNTSGGVWTGIADSASLVTVGARFVLSGGGATPGYAHGKIAGVRIYNRALTQPEIAQIYNAGAARIAQGGTP